MQTLDLSKVIGVVRVGPESVMGRVTKGTKDEDGYGVYHVGVVSSSSFDRKI